VIAAIDGLALGEGCELTLASDLVYASARTQFGRIEVHGGVVPGTWRLSRRVGDFNQRLHPDHGQQGINHLRSRVLISGLGCLLLALQILLSTIVVSASGQSSNARIAQTSMVRLLVTPYSGGRELAYA
jgi:enoyl-CoA hydratase/carnithine racemase